MEASALALTSLAARLGAAPSPSLVAGWGFLTVEEEASDEAMPIRAVADEYGPRVLHNPDLCPREALEQPAAAMLWLPMALNHISHVLLSDSVLGLGRLCSDRWTAFRDHCCDAMAMSWDEIVQAAHADGVSELADQLVAAVFVEGGIQGALARRMAGVPTLRLV